MAGISSVALPHATIPTQMFGNVNLQNAMMYVNDNFKALANGANSNVSAVNDALKGKSDATHAHDEAYAAIGHVHQWQDIQGLSAMLDGKAELNHEHSQYLSSLTAHYHDVEGVRGLGEALQAKAEKTHQHTMQQVEGLATEIGNKASTAYVDQQVGQIGSSVKPIVEQIISDKDFAELVDNTVAENHPKDVAAIPSSETAEQKAAREKQDIGTSDKAARADHQHRMLFSESNPQPVGNSSAGPGTGLRPARYDHVHALAANVATWYRDQKTTSNLVSIEAGGIVDSGQPKPGSGRVFTEAGVSSLTQGHLVEVGASGTSVLVDSGISSGDVLVDDESNPYVKESTAKSIAGDVADTKITTFSGTLTVLYAAKSTEATVATNTKNITTNTNGISALDARVTKLEKQPPSGGGTVKSVDSVTPTSNGNVALGALTEKDVGVTVQAYDAALGMLAVNLTDNGKVPFASIDGRLSGHSGNCLMYVNDSGSVGHVGDGEGGNNIYNLVAEVNQDGNKIITDTDIGNGLEADSSTHNIKVKCKVDGGIGVGSDGVYLGGLAGTGFVKTESGVLSVPQDQPITAPANDGFLKKSNGAIVGTEIAIGDLPTGTTSSTVAIGNHLHTNVYAPIKASFPGFGGSGSSSTASRSDHTHSASDVVGFGDAVQAVVDADNTILHTDDLRTELGASGKIITTGDICEGGIIVPCGDNHAACPPNHKHLAGSVGLNSDATVTLESWKLYGSVNIDASKVAGLTGSKWMKTTSGGGITTTDEVPIALPSGSGVLKSDGTSVTAGTLSDYDIPDLPASKITSGTVSIARIPTGVAAGTVALGNHDHGDVYSTVSHKHTPKSIGAAEETHNHTASNVTDFSTSVDARLTANNVLKSSDKRTPGNGSLLSTDDVCASGDVVPCGQGHCVPSSNHKHKPSSIGLNDSATTTLDSWIATGTANVDGSKVKYDNSSGKEKVAVISASGFVSASSDDYAKLTDTTPSNVGTANAVGTATDAARADHVHALPVVGGRTGDWLLREELFRFIKNGGGVDYMLQFKGIKFDKYGRFIGIGGDDDWKTIADNIMVGS